jgi:PKD repeat protein
MYNIGNGNSGNPTSSNLTSGNYNVTVTDAANCSSVLPVTITNTGLQPVSNFTYTINNGTVNFMSTAQNASAYNWTFGNGGGSSTANPIHTYSADGTYNVCLTAINDCGQHVFCQMLMIQTTIGVSGIIEKENGVPVASVKIHYGGTSPVTNNTNGTYTVTLPSGGNSILEPEKDTLYGNGVSGFDVFKIQRHILVVEALDSPYKIIAADVNHSNTVSTFDTYLMQQVILTNLDTFPNNTSWRFVVKDYVFPVASNPFAAAFPEAININNATSNISGADFIAIKIGDVTLDANPAIMDNPPSGKMELLLDETQWISNLAALQFNIQFDADLLDFEAIKPAELPGLEENDFNFKQVEKGSLSLVWYDKSGQSQQLDKNTVLFYILFKAKAAGLLSEALSVQPFRHTQTAYDLYGVERAVEVVFTKEHLNPNLPGKYKLSIEPNPFSEFVQILLEMPAKENGELAIYDLSGRLVYHEALLLEKGLQQIRIGGERFGAKGLYLLQVKTEGFVETRSISFQ